MRMLLAAIVLSLGCAVPKPMPVPTREVAPSLPVDGDYVKAIQVAFATWLESLDPPPDEPCVRDVVSCDYSVERRSDRLVVSVVFDPEACEVRDFYGTGRVTVEVSAVDFRVLGMSIP